MPEESLSDGEKLRSYKMPWKGQLVLACRKCRKKLKKAGKQSKQAKLGKRMAKLGDGSNAPLHIVDMPCTKFCPKGGVTCCTAEQAARNECTIVRSKRDLRALLEQCQRDVTR